MSTDAILYAVAAARDAIHAHEADIEGLDWVIVEGYN